MLMVINRGESRMLRQDPEWPYGVLTDSGAAERVLPRKREH